MTLTPLYDQYLEQLAQQEKMAALLAGAALLVILNVLLLKERRWLWLAAGGFWASWMGLLIWKAGDVASHWRPIRLGFLMNSPLWYDETFTWAVARLPIDRLLAATAGDVHPPTWYLIEHVIIRVLGDEPWALRFPSLLLGIFSLWLTYRLALALGYKRRPAVWSVAVLAALPGWVNYSQEARMYALLQAAILVAALGIYADRTWMMAVGMAAALWTHNLAFVPVGVLAALALWRAWGDRTRLTATIIYGAVAFCAWLPWLRVMVRQAMDVADGFWVPDYGVGGYLFETSRVALLINQPDSLETHAFLLFCGLVALVIWYCWHHRQWELLAMVLGPPLVLVAISEAWRPVFMSRPLVVCLPFLALGVVAAVQSIASWAQKAILVVLVPMLALTLVWPEKHSLPAELMSGRISDHYQAGDVIYHGNLASYILMSYHLEGYEHAVWPDAGDLSQALTIPTQRAMCIRRATADELIEDHDRLLVLWVENPMSTVGEVEALEQALGLGEARLIEPWKMFNTDVVTIELWEVRREESSMQMR
jgi:hypothetical protein